MDIGTAIHAGLASYANGEDPEAAVLVALMEMERIFVETPDFTLDGVQAIIKRCLKKAIAGWPDVINGGTVVAAELDMNHARLDLLHREPSGGLVITDHKYVHRLDRSYLWDRKQETATSWQLMDYASRVEAERGECPIAIQHYLVVGSPTTLAEVSRHDINMERVLQWRQDAAQVWLDMEGPMHYRNYKACLNKGLHYGRRCSFYEACHEPAILGDEGKMGGLYDRLSTSR